MKRRIVPRAHRKAKERKARRERKRQERQQAQRQRVNEFFSGAIR